MDRLIDNEGNVYEQGLGGEWHPVQGVFGPVRDTNIFGQPNIEQGLFGPTEARGPLGGAIRSADDRPLYQPISSPFGGSGGGSAGEALLAFLIVIAAVWIISALIALLSKLLAGLIEAWRGLEKRYPRAMLAVKLAIGMVAIRYGLLAAGFDPRIQLAGAALVQVCGAGYGSRETSP